MQNKVYDKINGCGLCTVQLKVSIRIVKEPNIIKFKINNIVEVSTKRKA